MQHTRRLHTAYQANGLIYPGLFPASLEKQNLHPLEDAIGTELLLALTGRSVSVLGRELLGLPARLGGKGSGSRVPVLPINSSGNQVGNRKKITRSGKYYLKKIVEFEASKRV